MDISLQAGKTLSIFMTILAEFEPLSATGIFLFVIDLYLLTWIF